MASGSERINLLVFEVTYLHSEPNGRVSLLEWRAGPHAAGIPVHVHEQTEEAFYVLRGKIALWLEGEEVVRDAGSSTVVPPASSTPSGTRPTNPPPT